jgi:hypothetical protein
MAYHHMVIVEKAVRINVYPKPRLSEVGKKAFFIYNATHQNNQGSHM